MNPAVSADEFHLSNEKKRGVKNDDSVLAWDNVENGVSINWDEVGTAGGDLGVGKQSGA